MLGSDYNRNSYTLNTSIAFGLKVVIWFIGGPFDAEGNVDPKHRFHHLVKIGREMHKLYPEIGKIGMPKAVYSTPTTKTHENKDKDQDVPFKLPPFPEDFWFRVQSGEAVAGFFKYPGGDDAIYLANHNAFAPQEMVIGLHGKGTDRLQRVRSRQRPHTDGTDSNSLWGSGLGASHPEWPEKPSLFEKILVYYLKKALSIRTTCLFEQEECRNVSRKLLTEYRNTIN